MNDELIIHIGTLLWHDYSVKFDNEKLVQKETNDGSPDWEEFHRERLANTNASTGEAYTFYEMFKDEYRETINRAFGLE